MHLEICCWRSCSTERRMWWCWAGQALSWTPCLLDPTGQVSPALSLPPQMPIMKQKHREKVGKEQADLVSEALYALFYIHVTWLSKWLPIVANGSYLIILTIITSPLLIFKQTAAFWSGLPQVCWDYFYGKKGLQWTLCEVDDPEWQAQCLWKYYSSVLGAAQTKVHLTSLHWVSTEEWYLIW